MIPRMIACNPAEAEKLQKLRKEEGRVVEA
jgi:hypothetical protein